jgi:benzylsuccinate CoA-transferase BbsF subunit
LKRPDLAKSPANESQLKRKENEEALNSIIAEWAEDLEAEEAAGQLQDAGVPATPVFNARDLIEDPHLRARGAVVQITHPKAGSRPAIGVPWRFTRFPAIEYRHAPLLGEHNEYVLSNLLGLTSKQIAELSERQVIY